MSKMVVYIGGKWVKKENAAVSVFDHGLLYGDGVFEGLRSYQGRIFRLNDHLKRLYESAGRISLAYPITQSRLKKLLYESLKRNRLKDAYIRLLITRGVGDLGLDPRVCKKPNVIIIADRLSLFPRECYEKGLNAITAKTLRNIPQALNPMIKSMNYLNNILAKIEANHAGVPEAIMLNAGGYVAECTGDNVFFVKNGSITTPPVNAGVLVGITRKTVIELAKKYTRLKVQEKLFRPADLYAADEVFFTGTAAEVIPVTKIDRRKIGTGKPGKVTLQLIQMFKKRIEKELLEKKN